MVILLLWPYERNNDTVSYEILLQRLQPSFGIIRLTGCSLFDVYSPQFASCSSCLWHTYKIDVGACTIHFVRCRPAGAY
jgi:hypothetical protein